MKIVTWNVNSIRARLSLVLDWLKIQKPDIVLLQELKCEDKNFPKEEIEDIGYNIALHGQKSFNGVALLSVFPLEDVTQGIPFFNDDQARYIEAIVAGRFRVASVYVPNGQSVGSDKFFYKLRFLDHLKEHIENLLEYDEITIIGGDYNIAPYGEDVYDADLCREQIMCSLEERKKFCSLLNLGYYDAIRCLHPHEQLFSWWDYRSGAFQKNEGFRIDHLLLSPLAVDKLQQTDIEKSVRFLEKTSDHAPVWCELEKVT
ncbi:MAG: exodeoxyribonuclease III [Proteobacteria bacterium]|nr:exodeoxyribonuclease III [Pseudomonadota bacterium]